MWNPFKKKQVVPAIPLKIICPELKEIIITPAALEELSKIKLQVLANIYRYKHIEAITGVPFDVIASIHYRESSFNFKTCLHNGDSLPGPTHHVPAGRGPFHSWEDAAIDALEMEKEKFPLIWDTQGKLAFCEKYNGLGYRRKGMSSPYVYSGTTLYIAGMYVEDGNFSASKVDHRLGCAAIIKSLDGIKVTIA